jgi:hypothetical protein
MSSGEASATAPAAIVGVTFKTAMRIRKHFIKWCLVNNRFCRRLVFRELGTEAPDMVMVTMVLLPAQ